MDLNKVMLIGNITRDPELRTTPSGQPVATFSVATNLVWTDASGQKQERAEFHNIVAWRKLAEIASSYLKKGSKVYVEGRLQTRSWDDAATSTKKYRTEVVADNFIMLDRAGSTSGYNRASNEGVQPSPKNDYSQTTHINTPTDTTEEINVEDIPF